MGYATVEEYTADREACPTDHARIVQGKKIPYPMVPEWIYAMMFEWNVFGTVFDCRCRDCGASLPMVGCGDRYIIESGPYYDCDEKPGGTTYTRKGDE